MDNSFFEYRNDSTRKSESDSEIIDNSIVAEESFVQIPKSAKKNQTVFVAQSEESDTDDDTESFGEDDVQEAPDTFKSIVRRSSAAGSHVAISSDEESGKRGSIGRQSGNSITKAVVLSSSSNEEASPEILPKRRPQARQKSMDSKSSESPLIRRVKRRMILTDSENDNSIVIEKDKTKKVQCLKDTPAKIDYVDRLSEKCLPKNMSIMSDDETDSNGDDAADPASDDGAEAVTDDDETEYPDEDEMVMSKATRMSIMGVRPKDLGSDESDFIQSSDDSNRLSSALSTHSLNDLPDAGISIHMTPAKTPASTGNHDDQQASNHGNDDMGNLDDSRISCSTFGSPVQDNSFTNDNVPKGNVAVTKDNGTQEVSVELKSPLKMIQVVDVKKMLKVDDDDDDVTIIDSKPEIIALSSDDDEETVKEKSPISRKKSPLMPSNPPAKAAKDNTLRQYLAPSSYPNSGVVYVKKNVRENELNKLNQLQADLHNVRNLLENMDVGTLPDGGVKLIERLSGLEAEVRRQGEKVANMIVETDAPPSNGMSNDGLGAQGNQGLTWEDIQKASNQVQPRMFGKQAMSTHMAERNLILDRLRDLHESLASRPPESADAAPPRGLKSALMPHQLHALAWLQWRETQRPAGGILADDMGLGKTITMISLVVSGKEAGVEDEDDDEEEEWGSGKENSRLVRGGTLVVCPASVLQQWAAEVAAHCRPHALSVCLHHGAARATQPRRLAAYDLVLTTYNILQRDTEKNGVLMRIRWTRVILDEAHIVRNHKSATSVAVAALRGARRWCLTGTPVQNKDLDVFALLKFLRLTPFEDLAMWKKWIDNKSMGGQERLSTIMRCILLRRTKAQLQQRGLLACLPHRDLHKIEVTLSKEEMNVYQKVLVFSKTLFAQFLHQRAEKQADAAGFASSQQAYDKMHKKMVQLHGAKPVKSHEILVLLLRLRQVCCHCGLIAAMLDGQEDVGDVAEDPASVDLLGELNKLSLEDAAEDRRRSKLPVEDEEEGPQQGTTAAEAIRSVLSPSNPVFQLSRMSSKIQAVMDCLLKQVLVNKGHKAVVVSQWTSVLRLVEEELRKANVRSVTLSGQVAVPARPPLVQALNDADSPVRVMLLSLCAGGVGLNLCGANHLLLLDPHWNPQLEEQAQDRIYRVGQKRPVHIYRYMCLDTVEQSIRRLQEAKLQLADNVLTGAKHNNASKLSIEDLKMLFNMGPTGE